MKYKSSIQIYSQEKRLMEYEGSDHWADLAVIFSSKRKKLTQFHLSLTRHVCLGYPRDSSTHQRMVMSLGDIAGISGMLHDITQEVSEIGDVSYFEALQDWVQICPILTRFKGARVLWKHQGWKMLALGVGASVFLYVKTAVVLQVLQSRFVNIVEFSKSDQPSMSKGIAQKKTYRDTPEKRTSGNGK